MDADKEVEREEKSTAENSAKPDNSSSSASWVHHVNMRGKLARNYNACKS